MSGDFRSGPPAEIPPRIRLLQGDDVSGKLLTDGDLAPLDESPCVSESEPQRLLARYPDPLPGDQVDPEEPGHWLFVGRVSKAEAVDQ